MAPDASPVRPPLAKRAVAYVRVSQARDGMISPELQLRAIEEYCRRRGYLITETLQDLDLSGRIWRNRQMEAAIGRIERGEAEAIVVWRWSRVSRNRLDWAVAVDRVETAGGALESATEGFDTSTSTGRMARGVLAELSAFESDRIGDVWREVQERRVAQGLPSQGHPMFGYRKRGDGTYVPDRRTGPILADMYRRYVDGTSFAELARGLNARHIKTVAARGAWTAHGLARIMDHGFAAGYIAHGGKLLPGTHQAIITAELWETFRARRDDARYQPRHVPDDFLALGLVWCGCGTRMTAVHYGKRPGPRYQCRLAAHPREVPGKSIQRDRLDSLIVSWVEALVSDVEFRRRVDEEASAWARAQDQRCAGLRQQLQTAGVSPEERNLLLDQLQVLRARTSAPSALADALLDDWAVLPGPVRRSRLGVLVDHVEIENLRPTPVLTVWTTWGTSMEWSGVTSERTSHDHPATPALGPAGDTRPPLDPLQLLTPAEAARITGVKVHTLRSWDEAGHLPHTQIAPDGITRRYSIQDLRRMRSRYKLRTAAAG